MPVVTDGNDVLPSYFNGCYGIDPSLLQLVNCNMRWLASRTTTDDADVQQWLRAHALTLYLPLGLIMPILRALWMREPNAEEFDEAAWECLYRHVRYSGQLIEYLMPNATVCNPCRAQIISIGHFDTQQHRLAMSRQTFRFSPIGYQVHQHQLWIREHRLGKSKKCRDIRKEGIITVSCTGSTNLTTGVFPGSDWRVGPQGVLVVSGWSYNTEIVDLEFEIENDSVIEPDVFVSQISDNVDEAIFYRVLKEVPRFSTRHFIIPIPISPHLLGFRYYELQIVVPYRTDLGIMKFMMFNSILQWDFRDRETEDAVNFALERIRLKTERNPDNKGLAQKPASDSNPRRDEESTGSQAIRACRPTRLSERFLLPYFGSWTNLPKDLEPRDNRPFLKGDFSSPPINEADDDIVYQLLDQRLPIDVGNFPLRLLAELLAQVEYEEDDPVQAQLVGVRPASEDDFDSPGMMHDTVGASVLANDHDCFYLAVMVNTQAFDFLHLVGTLVRVMHPKWPVKYVAHRCGKEDYDDGQSKLILRLNNGVRRVFTDPLTPRRGIFIAAPLGPAPGYQISLLRKVIYETHNLIATPKLLEDNQTGEMEVDSSAQDEQPNVHASATLEHRGGFGWRLIEDDEEEVSQPKPEDDGNQAQHALCYCTAWSQFYRPYFCDDDPAGPKPEWNSNAPELGHLRDLNVEQREVCAAVLRGQRLVLCRAPPGTGKTTCVARPIIALAISHPNKKFLCLTGTNAAANIMADRLVKAHQELTDNKPPEKMVLGKLEKTTTWEN